MKRYKTPAGNEYSEEDLRSKYGEQFDSLVADGTLQLVGESVNSEKKNPIVTPSNGEEVLTESTTETEVQDGVSDSLEVNEVVEEGVINESQLNFGDQTGPIVEEDPIVEEEAFILDPANIENANKKNKLLFDSGFLAYKELKEEDTKRIESLGISLESESIGDTEEYGFINPETGEKEFKKKSELTPELLEAIEVFDTAMGDVDIPNYSNIELDENDLDVTGTLFKVLKKEEIDLIDYRKWEKKNTRSENSVYRWMKKLLPNEEGNQYLEEKNAFEKLQSYKSAKLNETTKKLEKTQALLSLTSDPKVARELNAEAKELRKEFYGQVEGIGNTIKEFPKLKEATEDTDLRRRKIMYEASKEGGLSEGGQGLVELLSSGGNALGGFSMDVMAGIPAFIDQRLATELGYDGKGFLKGLEEMFTDSSEMLEQSTGAVNRAAFLEGKPVMFKAKEYIVDENGTVYDSNTNIRMDGIISSEEYKEIQILSKDITETETNWTAGSVTQGGVSTLVNLFALIRTAGKVKGKINLKGAKGAAIGMGLTSTVSGIAGNVEDVRSQLVASGMSEKESFEIAVNAGQAISTLDGVFSMLAGGNQKLLTGFTGIKDQIKNLAIKKGKNFTVKQLVDKGKGLLKENAKELFIEELPVYFAEKGINHLVNKHIGNDVLNDKITKAGLIETVVMTVGATTGLGARKLLSGNKRANLVRLAAANVKDLQSTLDVLVKEGSLTKKQASDTYTEVYNMQSAALKTQGTIKVSENLEPASDLLTQRQNLINKKQELEGPGKLAIDKQIKAVDQQLDALYKKDELEVQEQLKKDKDAISESITEEQVLPNEETSAVEGTNPEVGLQQVGEGNVEQVITETQVDEGDTQTNQVVDTTTESDTEQLTDTTSETEVMSVNKERVDSIVDGIVEKTKARNVGKDTDPKKILKNTLAYLQGSKLYQESTDIERENAVREINEKLGIKIKKPPTTAAAIKKAGKVLGLDIPTPVSKQKFTSTVGKEIKVFWNNWNKAFRESKYDQDTKRKDLNEIINSLETSGNLSKAKSKSLRNKVAEVNLNNTKVVSDVIDYARKSMNDADYTNKLNKSKKLRSLIKKNAKTKEAGLSDSAKNFSEIDPSKVEDIDTYLEKAQEIKGGLIPTKEVKSGLKTSTPFDTKKADEYTQKEKESQKEKAYELQKESFEDLTGLDSKDLTLEEMRDLLIALDGNTLTEEGKSKAVNEKKGAVEKALKQAISNAKINAKQVIADSDVEISKQDKKLLSEFLKMDMNVLTTEQKMKALDAILIFETNQSTGGMKSILKQAEGKKGMISLAKQKIITSAKSWMVGRYWNKSISTLPNVFELMFGSPQKGAIAMKNMGVTEAVNGAAKADRQSEDILTDYGNSFNKKKMKSGIYFDESNDIERGILGEIQRFTPGQEVKDFTDSKNLIEETYENLLKSTNKENIAKGEIIKEAYDRLVKDSNNISEVQSKADPANLEGVKYMTDVWASNYESLAEVSLNVYNKNLGKDTNYIPRSIQNISVEKSPDRDITQPLFNPDGTSSVYSKKTGVLEEATKPGKFKNSNKILNLGFDSQNMTNLKAALTDVNTAAAIQQIKGAITSDAFEQVFPNDQSRQIVKDRIIKYIDAKRAGEKINEDDKKLLKILNKGATFGVVKALGGLTQPFKQLVPIFNTAINAGPINTTKASALIFNKDVQDAINNSGLGIANRGASSQGDISGVDSRIKQAAKTKGGKIVDAIDKLNKDVIDVFLVKTDVQTARASFIAYYLKAMDKKGVKSGDIDFTKPLDKEASQYAQQQVDRQQNTSDSDLQGDLFTGKGLGVQVLRKTLFPFANFLLNQKTRMYSDINTLTRNRKTALPGDKTTAAKSLAGLATETAIFNAIGLGITQLLSNVARMYTGEEEDPNLTSFKNRKKQKEKKEKEFGSRLAGRIGNVVADVLVPIPAFNSLALSQANSLLSIMQEGDDNPFKFFAKTDKEIVDQLGVFGIGIKKVGLLVDMIRTINTGEVNSEYFGKKSSKKLTPEALEKLKGVASAYALHLVGLLPFSEVGYLSERAFKNISKMKVIDKKRDLEDEAFDLLEEEGQKTPNEKQIKERVKRIKREEKSGSSVNSLNTKSKLTGGLSTNLLKRKGPLD
jgi:hypothetical protein